MIRFAIVGYGYWGPNLSRNLAETPGVEVAAIIDAKSGRQSMAKQRHPGALVAADLGSVLRSADIDAVAIATPVASHFDLAMAALSAGKHVWLEKPMTETSDQAKQLIDEAERRRLVLMVDHTFVYTGAVRKISELMGSGELGKFYYYDSLRVNLGLFQADVNVISDLAVHDLAILDHMLGEHPVAVSANGLCHFPGTPENLAYVTLFYDSGAIAHLNVNWLAPVKIRRTLIGGSKKMLVYDDMEPSEKIKVYDKGISILGDPDQLYTMRIDYRAGDMWAPKIDVTEALRVECAHFVDCIETQRTPITDGSSGLRVVEVIEAATRSMRRRGETVEIAAPAAWRSQEATG
jgi:predicted dehydrogenase